MMMMIMTRMLPTMCGWVQRCVGRCGSREDWKKKREVANARPLFNIHNILCFVNSRRLLQRDVNCNLGQSKSQLLIEGRYHVIAARQIFPLYQVQILARH
jgi:hypothetical protein